MDDGRVSYEEAVEAIRKFGYLGIEQEDDVPFTCAKKKGHAPLTTWDYEQNSRIVIGNCTTIEDVAYCFKNGDCTLSDARTWCFINDIPQYELSKRIPEPRCYPAEFTGVYNTNPQKKEPWPYRLVAFLNRCLEILLNSILEDFE